MVHSGVQLQRSQPSMSKGTVASKPGAFAVRDLVYSGRTRYPRHQHEFSSLFVVLGGVVRESATGRRDIDCRTGAVGFIPAGAEHASEFGDRPAHGLTIVVDDSWLEAREQTARRVRDVGYAEDARATVAALRFNAVCRRPDAIREFASEELLLELLSATRPECGDRRAERRDARESRWLDSVARILTDHCNQPLELGDIAEAAGRNAAHMARAFRASMGCTMTEYILTARVARACSQLRTSTSPLVEVALASGFYDQAHFTRVFRRIMGDTPARYRAAFC
ncbi:MAG: helix-turn-helix domain-containing protein [Phycisphaerales bacterium]